MTIGMLQSTLFGDMFGTAAMRAVFGEPAFLQRCIEVEAALARAQARLGIVPADAATAISLAAAELASRPERLDLVRLRRETANVGYPILPPGGAAPRGSIWGGGGGSRPMSAPRSCRWCGSSPSIRANPAATCIGVPPPRTSWTRRSCCRSAPGWN